MGYWTYKESFCSPVFIVIFPQSIFQSCGDSWL